MSREPAKQKDEAPGLLTSTVTKLVGLVREEARYALPAAREASAHAVKEFGKKFIAVYERKKK